MQKRFLKKISISLDDLQEIVTEIISCRKDNIKVLWYGFLVYKFSDMVFVDRYKNGVTIYVHFTNKIPIGELYNTYV
jgi:hypothetical protein